MPRPSDTEPSKATRRNKRPVRPSAAGFRSGCFRLLKAGCYFLLREQARRAWIIFAGCFIAALLLSHWPAVRQGAIVMASLAAGAIFLPELNSKLWQLRAKEIRDTIPEHRRRAFYTELIRADCPDNEWAQRWATLMWHRGVLPLLDAARDNHRIRWDMTYEVTIHLHQEIPIGRRKELMALVEARQSDRRVIPTALEGHPAAPEGHLWVSMAGNDDSLLKEFGEDRCLMRELVCLPGLSKTAWVNAVRNLCKVNVRIGDRRVSFDAGDIVSVPGDNNLRIVRWLVRVTDEETAGTPVSCQIEVDFPTERNERDFPALLAGYYCAGQTIVRFRLYHGSGPKPKLRYYDAFISEGSGKVTPGQTEPRDTPDRQSVTYRTEAETESLLWPGSGIYFWWEYPD